MAGIALDADFERPQADVHAVTALLESMSHRAPDGYATAVLGGCAVGVAKQVTTQRSADPNPLLDERRSLLVVADLRLDNREELGRELAGSDRRSVSDLGLVALGYERWGVELAAHLIGDFALVIWDSRCRRVYAARDPFGTRPLFYHRTGNRIRIASEVDSLLAANIPAVIEDSVVLDYLLERYQHYRETFFREIFRVLPGHCLVADSRGTSEICHWAPPINAVSHLSAVECADEFRRLFRRSVETRLDSPTPIVTQLSGGLDSSSIACMADQIYAEDQRGFPSLVLGSAIFPGFNCDETKYIQAVADSVRFRSERWDARKAIWPPEHSGPLSYPCRDLASGIVSGSFDLARTLGGRVVLTGLGGDQLLFERGVFRDLAGRRRWVQLVRETLLARGWYSTHTRRFFLFEAIRPLIGRPALRRVYRRVRPRKPEPAPSWLAENLRHLWHNGAEPSPFESDPVTWDSMTQQITWRWLTNPEFLWRLELQELDAARAGIELRFPYLDRPLATFVLSLPFERRIPGGYMKRILRDAMAHRLPTVIAYLKTPTVFDATVRDRASQVLTQLKAVFSEQPWAAQSYVVQRRANELLDGHQGANRSAADWRKWITIWDIAMLERWLRRISSPGALNLGRRRGDGEAQGSTPH